MKEINKRTVWINIMGVMAARTVLFSMNPVAMAYFSASYAEKTNRLWITLVTILGMSTIMPMVDVIKYGLVMLVVIVITHLAERRGRKVTVPVMGVLAGVVSTALAVTKAMLYVNSEHYILLALLEGILIIALTNLFHMGVHYFTYSKKGQAMNNEEVISVAILLAIFAYALPKVIPWEFSLTEVAIYFFVLFMGYKYGSGSGAVAGAACGVVYCYSNGSLTLIGIMCMLGICAGMFREVGKYGTALSFFVTGVSLGYLYNGTMLEVTQLYPFLAGIGLFLILPPKILYRIDYSEQGSKENSYVKQNLQAITKHKLKEFSESFQKLSKTFYNIADHKSDLSQKEINNIFEELSEKLCRKCPNCTECWKTNYYSTYQAAYSMIDIADKNGVVMVEDIPHDFARRCIQMESFLQETNRSLELAKINLNWHNRMAESREAIAGQLGEVANIIKDFAVELYEPSEIESTVEEQMIRRMRAHHIEVKKLAILEKRGKKQEVYVTARTKKGRCITSKEAANIAGELLGKKMRPSDGTKTIIPKEFETIVLVEDTKFKTLNGMARKTKDGETVSGDSFSFLYLNSGEMIMTLSDGMGSGEEACAESVSVIELLEQFIEAGFREESAIKLINSVMVIKSNKQSFSTVDMSVINLFTGMCEFIKIGSAATFIKRNKWVETIRSTTLPVGVLNHVDFDGASKKLYTGDYVVMMTDGVLDCFPGIHKEKYVEEILLNCKEKKPQDIANLILSKALEYCDEKAPDDMTVIVSGMWEK
jgi:stage II sporulation protein E